MDEKEIKDMNLIERVEDFEKISKDPTLSPTLEYFYTKQYSDILFGSKEFKEVDEYYNSILFGQARNLTPLNIFRFSNENLDKLFENLNIKGKRVATVGSSGDQAIHCLYNGAKEVELIDVNFMAKPYTELKIAGIKALTFDEFSDLIDDIPKKLPKYYKKLSHYLKGDTKNFFDELVIEGTIKEFGRMLQNNDKFGSKFYENAFDYYQLKDILLKDDYQIKFTMAELEDFPKKLNGEYDLILLSNIIDYFDDLINKEFLLFLATVKELLNKNLTKGGALQVSSSGCSWDVFKMSKKLKAKLVSIPNAGMSGRQVSVLYQKSKGKHNDVIIKPVKKKQEDIMC